MKLAAPLPIRKYQKGRFSYSGSVLLTAFLLSYSKHEFSPPLNLAANVLLKFFLRSSILFI